MGEERRGGRRREQPADGGEHDKKAAHRSAVAGRGQFDDDGQGWGHRGGQTDADNEAQQPEQFPIAVRDKTVEGGADAADKGAEDGYGLAPPNIGQAAENQRADDRANAAGVEDQRRLAVGQMPARPDHREQEGDDGKIEEFENGDGRDYREDDPIAAAERRAVI